MLSKPERKSILNKHSSTLLSPRPSYDYWCRILVVISTTIPYCSCVAIVNDQADVDKL
jgi:hypothetical protein